MKRPLGYADGLGTGIAAVGLIAILYLSTATADIAPLYRNLATPLPTMTAVVVSAGWRVGVPSLLVAGVIAAHVWRPRFVLLALAALTLLLLAFGCYATYQPIFALAGNIRP